jgi:hypothetical protein
MSLTGETTRVVFNRILKKYLEYVALYKAIGDGSTEGITPFEEFYWRYTYHSLYSDMSKFARGGY